ncbi:MAG: hypothetical protein J7L64_06385 [Acidobacteria bacterium]|nr:hypothetical protein [Acidobacteriota bacterium]
MKCDVCGTDYPGEQLNMCPICHKHFCSECAVRRGGLEFCSTSCSEFFFFGEEEEEETSSP